MRIAMLSDVYFPRVNGVSTSIQTFRQQLLALEHSVTLICPDYPHTTPQADILRLPSHSVPGDREDRAMSPWALWRLAQRFSHAPAYDILHVHTPFLAHYAALRLARQWNCPLVGTFHTFFEQYLFHYLPWLPRQRLIEFTRHWARRQCQCYDGMIVPSSALADVLREYGVTTELKVLPTGFDQQLPQGDGQRFRAQYGIPAERPVLVYIGRIAHEKNIDFLLRMLQQLRHTQPDVLLVIAGEGPALTHLKHLGQQLGVAEQVLWVGYLQRGAALADCYCAGDIFVFASRTETQGLVLLEAMSQGVPIVALAELGARDVLAEGRGCVIVPHAEEPLFAATVQRTLADSALLTQLRQQGPHAVQHWRSDRLTLELVEWYQFITGRFAHTSSKRRNT